MRLTLFSVLLLVLAACSDNNSNTAPEGSIPTDSSLWKRNDNIKVNTFAMKTVDACNGFALEGTDTVITDLIRIDRDGRAFKLENIKAGQVTFTPIGQVLAGVLSVTSQYKSEFLPFDPASVNLPLTVRFDVLYGNNTMKLVAQSEYDAGAGTMKTFNTTEQNFTYMSVRDADIYVSNAVACSYLKAP